MGDEIGYLADIRRLLLDILNELREMNEKQQKKQDEV